jgi:hypothetical protein
MQAQSAIVPAGKAGRDVVLEETTLGASGPGYACDTTLAPSLVVVGDGFGAVLGGRGEVGVEMVLESDVILSWERPLEYRRGK